MRIAAILLLTVLLLPACGRQQPRPARIRPVKVYTAGSLGYINRDFTGMAVPDSVSNLAFRVSGQLIKLTTREGVSVRKGSLIAELDARDFRLRVSSGKSAYRTAQAQLERTGRLLEHQAVSRQDYEIAQTRYAEAKSAYENAVGSLGDTRLTAPFSGIVEKQYVDNFQRVQAGEAVVRLVDPSTRTVRFTLSESGIPLMSQPGKRFTVEFDNYSGVLFGAYLKEYVPTSSDGMGVPVTLGLDDKRLDGGQYQISPGMSCTINLRIDNRDKAALTSVPITALYAPDGGQGDSVWVVDKDDAVHLRAVKLGDLYGSDMVVVESGLQPGDRVVIAGVYRLGEGEKVRVLSPSKR